MKKISLSIFILCALTWNFSFADMERSIPQRVLDSSLMGCHVSCGSPSEKLRKRCDFCDRDVSDLESFALPGGLVRSADQQEEQRQTWFGVTMEEHHTGSSITDLNQEGVYIATVEIHSPASYAGLRSGDCIVDVEGIEFPSIEDVNSAVQTHSPGECMELIIRREGAEQQMKVILGIEQGIQSDSALVHVADREAG